MYRFVLTFIVGASIVVSLIGRGEIAEDKNKIPGAQERMTGGHGKATLAWIEGQKAEAVDAEMEKKRKEEEAEEAAAAAAEKEKEESEGEGEGEDKDEDDSEGDDDKKEKK